MTNHVVKVNNPVRERANGCEAFDLMSSSKPASTGETSTTGIGNANTSSFAYREQLVDHVASRLATCKSIPSHKRGPHTGDAHDLMKVEFERLDASPRDALSMLIPYLFHLHAARSEQGNLASRLENVEIRSFRMWSGAERQLSFIEVPYLTLGSY